MKKYTFNILISLDQLVNAILFGDPDETISSRLGKWLSATGWRYYIAYPICQFLWMFDTDHCNKSVENDEGDDAIVRSLS